MILEALPDIPRWYTGIAEWGAVVVYLMIVRPRFGGWTRFAVIAAALPVMIGLQVFAGTWPISLWILGMSSAALSIFGFLYLCADTSAKDAGYLAARAFVLAELVASLQWQLEVYGGTVMGFGEQGWQKFIGPGIMLAGYGIGFTFAYLVERKNFHSRVRLGVDMRALVLSLAISSATFMVSNLSFVTTNTPFSGQQGPEIFYIRTLVDLAGFIALYSQQSNRNIVREALELSKTRMLMRSQYQQYLQSKRNIEELNRMHHDLKYYAAAIRAETSADKRSEYLQVLEDSMRGYESEIQTGNAVLDIVLSSKMEHCLQEGISMVNMVEGKAVDFIDAMELAALFGNALDNAIEAELKVAEPEKRIIKVSIFTQDAFVMIRIENYCPWPVTFANGLPVTTKADRSRHGYGTASMLSIVEQYDGSLTMSVEDDWYVMRALIPHGSVG